MKMPEEALIMAHSSNFGTEHKPMKRILTGIQSNGNPHLGNVLGAILPAIQMSNASDVESFLFIADLHALTSLKNKNVIEENTTSVAAAWLAFGLDADRTVFYRQSRVPMVTELAWFLNCFAPFPMLANAHSFKDKSERLADVNAGLFTYPMLMAADILLYQAHEVPVGKDQVQHLEMTRDVAGAINRYAETELFVLPQAKVSEEVMIVPGTDGQKMSKSYGNIINIFLSEKELDKVVKTIVTDSTPMEDPKDPERCNVYALYKLVATPEQAAQMAAQYRVGGYGYGHAKRALFEVLWQRFEEPRKAYRYWMENPAELNRALEAGEEKAAAVASETLNRVRQHLGYGRM